MIQRLFTRKIRQTLGLFNGHFVDAKNFYVQRFDALCCVSFIGDIDTSRAFALLGETIGSEVVCTYQHSFFDHNEQRMFFNNTVFVLTNKRMVELGNNWCQVLHTPGQHGWANELIQRLAAFRTVSHEPVIGFARQATAI